MTFLPIRVNNNVFLIPGGSELITDGDDVVLLCDTGSKKKKQNIRNFSRLKCINIEPGTKIIVVSLNQWASHNFERQTGKTVTSGMTIDKSELFSDDPADQPTKFYFGEKIDPNQFIEFADYESAALWSAIQEPLTVYNDGDLPF